MKNFLKFLGIIAMVAVIGFSMAACSDDENNDDESGNNNGGGVGITIQNCPASNVDVFGIINGTAPTTKAETNVSAATCDLTARASKDDATPLAGKATDWEDYKGSDSVLIFIATGSSASRQVRFVIVKFTSGSATVDWDTMTDVNTLDD